MPTWLMASVVGSTAMLTMRGSKRAPSPQSPFGTSASQLHDDGGRLNPGGAAAELHCGRARVQRELFAELVRAGAEADEPGGERDEVVHALRRLHGAHLLTRDQAPALRPDRVVKRAVVLYATRHQHRHTGQDQDVAGPDEREVDAGAGHALDGREARPAAALSHVAKRFRAELRGGADIAQRIEDRVPVGVVGPE